MDAKTKRLLLFSSGGYCQNPNCNKDLFQLFKNGAITNIEELAHIISKSKIGPRGQNRKPLSCKDKFENIIVLCPTCHIMIDKNPKQFSIQIVKDWKRQHIEKIKSCFNTPRYETRKSLKEEIEKLLMENYNIYQTYGPNSNHAQNVASDAADMWKLKSIENIIPNNRKICELIKASYGLLRREELKLFEKFKLHKEGFEYNKLSGEKSSSVPLFPEKFKNILK